MKAHFQPIFLTCVLITAVCSVCSAQAVRASRVITQTVPMYYHDDVYDLTRGEDVGEGAEASITRTRAGVGIHVSTHNLQPGTYTVWLLVYNKPKKCEGPDCNLEDILGNDKVKPAALRIGHDFTDTGSLDISAWVPAKQDAEDSNSELLPGSMFGSLSNPLGAELDVVLKWHGHALDYENDAGLNILDLQMHTVDGGCAEQRELDVMDPPVIQLDDGFELCPDPQGATFPSPKKHFTWRLKKPIFPSFTPILKQSTNVFDHADVYDLIPGNDVAGSEATITRTKEGIGVYFKTNGLPNGTYTVWYLIYNDPADCEGPCNLADILGNPAAAPAAIRAGHDIIINDGGNLTHSSWLSVNQDAENPEAQVLPGSLFGTLTNPLKAEVHVVLKWHGAPLDNGPLLDEQIHSVDGGCYEQRMLGVMDPPVIQLEDGFELCPDPQGAIFGSPLLWWRSNG